MRFALGDVVSHVVVLLTMGLAVGVVAGLAYLGQAEQWRWYVWLIASPVLYFVWLIIFLLLSGLSCRPLGNAYPKPRYAVFGPGHRLSRSDLLGFLSAWNGYGRFDWVTGLPLVQALMRRNSTLRLVLGSYSPSYHVGRRSTCAGYLLDPDLTEIGDDVIIGAGVTITAHTVRRRPNGELVFVAAPVSIGNGATIGGCSLVEFGCEIGENAIVEVGSVVYPYTKIGPGEVWGGNPACLRRAAGGAGLRDQAPSATAMGQAEGG